ncbi:ssDNA-binding protein [uncultured Bradyrhizobium sp.]|uniref:ssDNA-binding protein n=1 Tax=uncultured Bradyrhizobium sp. TaxID=199684 RepID=UPI00261C663A|nr:ssDNA-binding protein [uncultured Bradyrhizobium sp.]
MSQNLIDHVAILTSSALASAQVNKLKPGRGPEFYAVIAFPPAAGAALHALCLQVATLTADIQVNVKPNASTKKPIVGIPPDWLIVRASTQYAPYVADESGKQLMQDVPTDAAKIRQCFYAGKRVRAALSAFAWSHATGGKGVSFNIDGVMAVEDGERLAIGNGAMVNAFEKFAQPAAAGAVAGSANPFAGASTGNAAAPAAAPAPAANANPFAAAATAGANPFATAA